MLLKEPLHRLLGLPHFKDNHAVRAHPCGVGEHARLQLAVWSDLIEDLLILVLADAGALEDHANGHDRIPPVT